ncbi:MAG TPA: hypothetical protein VF541_18890 [Longimicrobium sp.]|jgi:hypothetical protein
MPALKSHQIELLRAICTAGAMPAAQTDGRVRRPLEGHGLVTENGGMLRPTPAGRALAARPEPASAAAGGPPPLPGRLSEKQEEVLRYMLRQTGPVPTDHLDGRVLRALSSRGLLEVSGGWARPTAASESHLQRHAHRDRQLGRRRAASSARAARAEAILRVTEQLEHAIPLNTELMIGGHPAYADDVIAGLRKLVREME